MEEPGQHHLGGSHLRVGRVQMFEQLLEREVHGEGHGGAEEVSGLSSGGEVARYGCPSPRRRSPAHEAGARGARQSGKKCGAPGCCQFFLDHRARYGFSCHKTCHELHLSWHCCLSGCPYGGTVPLAETPGGSEIPRLLEDFQITGSSWERRGLPCGRRGRASTCLDR
ncbi:uncharacterized protein [Odocoileus virginianus]|uniref:Uncharacterized protein isoform X5 n=1 Tax=Odocoileus virginianus TaxID=9874 RepID=A0ABM4J2B1_ODOVR